MSADLAKLEADLDAALAARVAEGWTVVTGAFGVPEAKTCCALTALCADAGNITWERQPEPLSQYSLLWLEWYDIMEGFDYGWSATDLQAIGQRLRAKYVEGAK